MAVNYKAVAKKNPLKQQDPPKYYANIVTTGNLTLRQLAKEISTISTVSVADTMAVLEGLLEVVPKQLANGNIVRLGDFGSFNIQVKSEGADNAKDLSKDQIIKTSVKFRAGKEFMQVIDNIEFIKTT